MTSCDDRPGQVARLTKAMASHSLNGIWNIKCLLDKGEKTKHPSGAFKRKAAAAIGPFCACYKDVCVPAREEGTVTFAVADIRKTLALLAERNASFKHWIDAQERPLQYILGHDETTAGNVLSTAARQKVMLIEITFTGMANISSSSRAWLPIAAMCTEDVDRVDGGASTVTAEVLRELQGQDLQTPFHVMHVEAPLSLKLKAFLADHDAQRETFLSKGSAGLRCCLFCSNCLSKSAKAPNSSVDFFPSKNTTWIDLTRSIRQKWKT